MHSPNDLTASFLPEPTLRPDKSERVRTEPEEREGAFVDPFPEVGEHASFQAILDTLPHIFWTALPSGETTFCNRRFYEYTGLTTDKARGTGWADVVHPDDLPGYLALRRAGLDEGTGWHYEYRLCQWDGSYRWFLVRVEPVRDAVGTLLGWVGTATDHHEHRLAEERQKFLTTFTERVRALADTDEVLYEAARMIGEFTGVDRCTFGEVNAADTENGTITVHRDFVQRGIPSIGGMTRPLLSFGRPIIEEMRSGIGASNGVSAIRDVLTDPRVSTEHRAAFAELGIRSLLGAPIFREGNWVSLLVLHHGEPRTWPEEERDLLSAVAESTRLAVDNARLFRETRARAEREAIINQIGDGIRQSLPPEEIEALAIRVLGTTLQADRCYLMALDLERDSIAISRDWCAEGVPSVAGQYRMSDLGVDFTDLFRQGQTLVVPDARPESEQRLSDQNARTNEHVGVTAFLNVPFYEGERIVGALGVAMAGGARHWTEEEVTLAETVAGQLRSAVEAARLQQRERNIAQQLQVALTPPTPQSTRLGLTLASYYRAALGEAEVGGDFHDVFALDERRTVLVVADLSGKGLAAAQQVATVRNMLRFALYTSTDLANAVSGLHQVLVTQELLSGFATLFVGIFDHTTRVLTYVNAGQEPGVVWRASTGQTELMPPTGPVLGGFGSVPFRQEEISVLPGDVLALYTDGLTDVGPNRRSMLGVEGVRELLDTCSREARSSVMSAQGIVDCLIARVDRYAYGGGRDDIALLVAVVTPGAEGLGELPR